MTTNLMNYGPPSTAVAIPEAFICPITKKIMWDPVTTRDGSMTLERDAYEQLQTQQQQQLQYIINQRNNDSDSDSDHDDQEQIEFRDVSLDLNYFNTDAAKHNNVLKTNVNLKMAISNFINMNPAAAEHLYFSKILAKKFLKAIRVQDEEFIDAALRLDLRLLSQPIYKDEYYAFHVASQAGFGSSPRILWRILRHISKELPTLKLASLPRPRGWNPVHLNDLFIDAVSKGRKDDCAWFLEIGADPRSRDRNGNTVLHLAIKQEREDLLMFFLEKDAVDVNAVNNIEEDSMTPLHVAVIHNLGSMVRLLVEGAGANIEATDAKGRTPLYLAASHDDVSPFLLNYLLTRGAKVDAVTAADGSTPFAAACLNGRIEAARILFEKGAKVTATNMTGNTALHGAARNGHRRVVEWLLSIDGNGNNNNNNNKDNNGGGDAGLIRILNQYSNSALHRAALGGHYDVVELLIEKGGRWIVEQENSQDQTAADVAEAEGHRELAQFIRTKAKELKKQQQQQQTTAKKPKSTQKQQQQQQQQEEEGKNEEANVTTDEGATTMPSMVANPTATKKKKIIKKIVKSNKQQ